MKGLYIIVVGLFCYMPVVSQGIQFHKDITWKQALSLASDSNKMIFVDIYTDWCGPCRQMDKEVFPLKEIGQVFNKEFINYRLNAEQGEGPAIAEKYHVISYPTYLFVRGDGTLIYKARSSMKPDELLKEAGLALKELAEPVTIVQMDSLYPSHRHDKTFMYGYIQRRTRLALKNADLLDEYFRLLNEREKGELKNLQLVVDNGSFRNRDLQIGPAFYALLKNKDKFNLLKKNKYNDDLSVIIDVAKEKTVSEAIEKKNEKLLNEALKFNNHADLFEGDDVVRMRYYRETHQNGQYFALAKQYINSRWMTLADTTLDRMDQQIYDEIIPKVNVTLASRDNMTEQQKEENRHSYKRTQTIQVTNNLNENSRYVLSFTTSQDTLRQGLQWINHALHLARRDTDYFKYVYPLYLDTYATYLYELKRKEEAIKTEQQAIDLMKRLSDDDAVEQFTSQRLRMKKGEQLSLTY